MNQGHGVSVDAGIDSQHQNASRVLQLAVDRLLAGMTRAEGGRNALAWEIAEIARRNHMDIPPSAFQGVDNDLEALRWLLGALAKISQPILEDAVHRAIQLLSIEASFERAVERSARRQVYNLAYGLTHEINNPLANIVARAQKLMGELADPHARKSLATMMDQGMRAHEMLAEVMRAVQPSSCDLVPTDIASLVGQVSSSLQDRSRAGGIVWECLLQHDRIFAAAHAPSLLDALRMLGTNSIDVCQPNDRITWICESIDDGFKEIVRISLTDTGPGLSSLASNSAMDLFFSGREHGRGLGISLAAVRRIVEMHRGTIAIRSEEGSGCCVEIELPGISPPIEARPEIRL
jgi:signal transduction histidine kinase